MSYYKITIRPFLTKNIRKMIFSLFVLFILLIISICYFNINQVLVFILTFFVAIFYNPIFWVSVLGPFFQSLHFLWLRSKLGIGYKAKVVGELPKELLQELDEIEGLRKTLNENDLAYALSDFNTQLFVTSVAFIFLMINVFTVISNFFKKFNGEIVNKVLSNDILSLCVLILFVIFFVIGIFVLLSGRLISYKVLKYYKPEGGIITGETRFPPMQSGLTWFRYSITAYSILYTYWVNEHVPVLFDKMKLL